MAKAKKPTAKQLAKQVKKMRSDLLAFAEDHFLDNPLDHYLLNYFYEIGDKLENVVKELE